MFHMVGFYESIDPAAALVPIAGIADQSVTVNGDDIRVLPDMPFLIGGVFMSAAANFISAQIQSPSLRASINQEISPVIAAVTSTDNNVLDLFPENPRPLAPDESLNFYVNTNPASAEAHYGFAYYSDGPQTPVQGEIITVRATAAAALSAGVWVNSALTFTQTLPVGRYQVVGMKAYSANLVAARLVFVGAAHRPGVIATTTAAGIDNWFYRQGHMGVWGEFHTNTPPTVDCLGITDTAETIILDLIRL